MLCAAEPVKCCRRLPKCSGSTTRRSTGRPVCVRPRAAFSFGADADSMRSSSPSARTSAPGSDAVAMMSRSLTESAWRRAEPASSTRSAAGCARSASTICSPIVQRAVQQHALRRALADPGVDRRQHRRLELRPEALDVAQRVALGGRAQRRQRVDPELGEELARALGPEARQARHLEQAGRVLRAQLLGGGDRPGVEQGDELLLERLADPRQRGHASRRASAPTTDTVASRAAFAAERYAMTRCTIAPSSS